MIHIDQNKQATHKAQLHISELSNVWENPDDFSLEDFLMLIKDIAEESLKHGRIYSKYFIDEVKEKMIDLGICPECGEELGYKIEKETHNEIEGSFYEESSVKTCNECGWINE